jgi:DNA polymerase-3 subunit chi
VKLQLVHVQSSHTTRVEKGTHNQYTKAHLHVSNTMTAIDFYILGHSDEHARFNFACRLSEKVYGEGHQVYIHVENAEQAQRLDDLMWSYKPEAFLPHNLVTDEQPAQVQIGWQDHPAHHFDVMINLSSPQPTFFSRFARVLEIVIQDETVLAQTRKHFKFYKDRGYEVTHRDLRG